LLASLAGSGVEFLLVDMDDTIEVEVGWVPTSGVFKAGIKPVLRAERVLA